MIADARPDRYGVLPLGVAIARAGVMAWPPGWRRSLYSRISSARMPPTSAYLMAGPKALADKHPLVGDVRGRGLMIGVELVRDHQTKERATRERGAVVTTAFKRGLLVLAAGKNSVRFSPPLVLTRGEAETAVRIFDEALTEVEGMTGKNRGDR